MLSEPHTAAVAPGETAKLHSEDVISNLPAPENKKFYSAPDGLRAIAVLMVFYQHYLSAPHPSLNWGWTGVDFFFVLSGFLITGILYDTRHAANRFCDFYMRRAPVHLSPYTAFIRPAFVLAIACFALFEATIITSLTTSTRESIKAQGLPIISLWPARTRMRR